MIYIFYYKSLTRLKPEVFEYYFQQLPSFIQKKISGFRNWQDAERSLAGNILLMGGLRGIGKTGYLLQDLKFSAFQKPYFDDLVNFNISHSGQYTICAISETTKVGIDVEEIRDIPLIDFDDLFSKEEWHGVMNANDKLRAFYTLWTKKEAFLKAIGSGLNVPLNKVNIKDGNKIVWNNENWFLHQIELDSSHLSYICTNNFSPAIHMNRIDLTPPVST